MSPKCKLGNSVSKGIQNWIFNISKNFLGNKVNIFHIKVNISLKTGKICLWFSIYLVKLFPKKFSFIVNKSEQLEYYDFFLHAFKKQENKGKG